MRNYFSGCYLLLLLLLTGCAATVPATPGPVTLSGIGIGNLLGATHLEKTAGVLKGDGIGEGIGYLINNKNDQDAAGKESEKTRATGYQHRQTGTLAGTRWDLVTANAKPAEFNYKKVEVDFEPNGKVLTRVEYADGKRTEATEIYRVFSGVLIVNRPGYLVNVSFISEGDYLTVVTPTTTVVMKKRGT